MHERFVVHFRIQHGVCNDNIASTIIDTRQRTNDQFIVSNALRNLHCTHNREFNEFPLYLDTRIEMVINVVDYEFQVLGCK